MRSPAPRLLLAALLSMLLGGPASAFGPNSDPVAVGSAAGDGWTGSAATGLMPPLEVKSAPEAAPRASEPNAAEPAPKAVDAKPSDPDLRPTPQASDSKPAESAPAVVAEAFPLPAAVEKLKLAYEGAASDRKALAEFYSSRASKPAWIGDGRLLSKGEALIEEIGRAGDWGLKAADFPLPDVGVLRDGKASPEEIALVDATLSAAVLKYARHARGGRFNPTDLSRNLDVQPQVRDPRQVIGEIAEAADVATELQRQHPRHPQFEKLRQVYLSLRKSGASAEERSRGEAEFIPDGRSLRPGDRHPHVALVRKRLGVNSEWGPPDVYDDELADAVATFQRKAGLQANAVVSNRVRKALNGGNAEPEKGNAAKVLANMERWRYVPDNLGKNHVWVNVPEFMVRVVSGGQVIHSERVITGKADTQTAIFSAPMQRVIFHPYWNVPMSIKVKELQPSLSRGAPILERQGLRVKIGNRDLDPSSVDWGSVDMNKFHIYQPPGGRNVLGIVKFEFPNKHTIYMHDTPTKNLFNTDVRTYSHGCVRVRNPQRLAEVMLGLDKGWSPGRIAQLVESGPQDNQIALSTRIPVHVVYFTAWVDEDGKPQYRKDHYGHDNRITQALAGTPVSVIARSDPALIQERSVKEARQRMLEQPRRYSSQGGGGGGGSPFGSIFSWILN